MTVQSEIFPGQGYVVHSVLGPISIQEIQAAWAPLMKNQAYHPELNVVWHFMPGSVLSISAEDMPEMVKKVAAHIRERGSSYRLALVSDDDLNFGVSRMFEGLAAQLPVSVSVFRELDDALAWVSVET